jgi:hypothetical protein
VDELEWDFIQAGRKAQKKPKIRFVWDGLMVQVNHRESADWPGPHVHRALAIPLGSQPNRTLAFNLGACHVLRAGRIPAFRA